MSWMFYSTASTVICHRVERHKHASYVPRDYSFLSSKPNNNEVSEFSSGYVSSIALYIFRNVTNQLQCTLV
jgi:hypothetical protein